jgi:hypothetical protein
MLWKCVPRWTAGTSHRAIYTATLVQRAAHGTAEWLAKLPTKAGYREPMTTSHAGKSTAGC